MKIPLRRMMFTFIYCQVQIITETYYKQECFTLKQIHDRISNFIRQNLTNAALTFMESSSRHLLPSDALQIEFIRQVIN